MKGAAIGAMPKRLALEAVRSPTVVSGPMYRGETIEALPTKVLWHRPARAAELPEAILARATTFNPLETLHVRAFRSGHQLRMSLQDNLGRRLVHLHNQQRLERRRTSVSHQDITI